MNKVLAVSLALSTLAALSPDAHAGGTCQKHMIQGWGPSREAAYLEAVDRWAEHGWGSWPSARGTSVSYQLYSGPIKWRALIKGTVCQ